MEVNIESYPDNYSIESYSEFKFFKSNYVQMNKIDADYIYISGILSDSEKLLTEVSDDDIMKGDYLKVYFKLKSPFYKIYGKIKVTTEFHKWLKGKCIRISTTEFRDLGKLLKKDTKDILFSKDKVIFNYNGGSISFESLKEYQKELDDGYKILEDCGFNKMKSLSPLTLFSDELTLYLDEYGNPITEKTDDKFLEVPTGTLKPLYSPDPLKVLYSDRNELGQRYVYLISKNLSGDIEISQLFLTI